MNIKLEGNELVIRLPLQSPQRSSSGKTMIVATTAGFRKTDVLVDGKPISVSVNATIKA